MKKKDDIAIILASMLGHQGCENYSDGLYNTIEIYENLTGKKLGIKRTKTKNKITFINRIKMLLSKPKKINKKVN